MKRTLVVLFLLALLFALTVVSVQAQVGGPDPDGVCRDAAGGVIDCPEEQGEGGGESVPGLPGDRDGDGLADGSDRCPDAGGHANLAGCPDADGDNTPDIDDTCPTVGGPDSAGGCPVEDTGADTTTPQPTEAPAQDPALLPPLPTGGECVVATLRDAAVNVRNAPNLNAAVVGALAPGQTYAIAHIWIGADGAWYRIVEPAGWVASAVLRVGGDCSQIALSDFSDPASAAGAVPHWGPNGELTFCLPDYELGEDTCVPNTNGAVPHWGPNGELTFCAPDIELGEETCVVIPSSAKPHWNTLDDIVYCLPDDLGGEDCFVLDADETDGGIVIRAALDETGAPPENPEWHKFLLVGEDGLLVLTAPVPDDGETERPNGVDFPLYFALCTDETNPDCDYQVMMHGQDLPLAACYYDPVTNPEVEACDTDNLAGKVQFQDFHFRVMHVPFTPDLPLAACYYDPITNPEVEPCDTDNLMGAVFTPDLPIAACFYDSQTNPEVEACDTDNLMNQHQPDDLPIAACAFNPDAIIQCETDDLPDGYVITLQDVLVSSATGQDSTMPQTREHILLARQVQVPSLLEEGLIVGLELTLGEDDTAIGLLLPAVQKVREAA